MFTKHVLYGQLLDAPRTSGGQKLWFKDILRHNLRNVSIDHRNWEVIKCDHSRWKKDMRLGLECYEEARVDNIVEKRSMQHNCTSENLTTKHVCHICNRVCNFALDSLHMNVLTKDNQTTTEWKL